MNIVVLIKQVPGTDNVKMDPKTGTMIRTGKDNIINPLDENALEEALRLKRSLKNVTVTVVSMGPESAMKAIKEAIAMGADGGILLSGRAFAGSDTIATARVLSSAIRKLWPVDLILCGERATDGETGQTGAMVAAMLDIPVQTYVQKLEVGDGIITVERLVEGGFERVQVKIPALVTVVKGINQPGFPTLAGKLRAKEVQVPVWGPEDVGLVPDEIGLKGSPTRVVKIFSPKLSRDTIMYRHDNTGRAISELINFLGAREIIV
ncbi:electron transfer flavoprotein beta subunit [Desulfofundulus australicus DSM 11792]|uniref:Electron transfer flavoprotein small subunit n=1 Tax=Desulfofundulus australicus DSM 11792 TaxID=1121425 RepID=A0A1M4UM17_9FIRM|nr:electron transfer flavoprotein subunit beta/FixA family protein [Desulfofundulus australicus]SHE57705.1 electron transfer flavoprotein beta subunit [Desulfofundulus australicus DSM 11792]